MTEFNEDAYRRTIELLKSDSKDIGYVAKIFPELIFEKFQIFELSKLNAVELVLETMLLIEEADRYERESHPEYDGDFNSLNREICIDFRIDLTIRNDKKLKEKLEYLVELFYDRPDDIFPFRIADIHY